MENISKTSESVEILHTDCKKCVIDNKIIDTKNINNSDENKRDNSDENKRDNSDEKKRDNSDENKRDNNKPRINKGTGAGGAKTTYNGKTFEEKTDNQKILLNTGYIKKKYSEKDKSKYNYYLYKKIDDKTIIFTLQDGFKTYIKKIENIDIFRKPDEVYIVEHKDKKTIKILEKKAQYVEGSVEMKLWSGTAIKREYEILLKEYVIQYAFCVSDFLKKKLLSNEAKYKILNKIFEENNITILFGDDSDYFEKLDLWINS